MLPLHTHGQFTAPLHQRPLKVLQLEEALSLAYPPDQTLIDLRSEPSAVDKSALVDIGFHGFIEMGQPKEINAPRTLYSLKLQEVVSNGDVINVRSNGQVSVLYRRSANANALFVTERCNSHCLMCSQPPRDDDDSWRISEILNLIPLIDRDLAQLGITGGEPTLLGPDLKRIIDAVKVGLPSTSLHILTNGRHFSDRTLVDEMESALGRVQWAIPLYAETASRHDYVVQSEGAFEQTLHGIYNLAERKHSIEIRMVLHKATVGRLAAFAEFLYRNLPFVDHVAMMGLEPMGFAKTNRAALWIDPLDYAQELTDAVWYLHDRGIRTSIYNTPLCVLPKDAWPFAQKSISDWKNVFSDECANCSVNGQCGGFFRSAGPTWKSRGIRSIRGERADEGLAEIS